MSAPRERTARSGRAAAAFAALVLAACASGGATGARQGEPAADAAIVAPSAAAGVDGVGTRDVPVAPVAEAPAAALAVVDVSASVAEGAPSGAGDDGADAHAWKGPLGPPPAEGALDASDRAATPARLLAMPAPWRSEVEWFVRAADAPAARERSLARRAGRRTYEGAPPVIPHSNTFGAGSRGCAGCHTSGMAIGEKIAHPMSHPELTQCLQCHVESASPVFTGGLGVANRFDGVGPAGPGARSADGAPPSMPHGELMRGRCLACHGEFGYAGLQTSHPRRASCTQCHVASGTRDLPWPTADAPSR